PHLPRGHGTTPTVAGPGTALAGRLAGAMPQRRPRGTTRAGADPLVHSVNVPGDSRHRRSSHSSHDQGLPRRLARVRAVTAKLPGNRRERSQLTGNTVNSPVDAATTRLLSKHTHVRVVPTTLLTTCCNEIPGCDTLDRGHN